MYAEIINLDTNHVSISGHYETLAQLNQNAVFPYWIASGQCDLEVKYFSSFEALFPFKTCIFNHLGLVQS